jgi:hypothetical protein
MVWALLVEDRNEFDPSPQQQLERETRLELAAPTLARSGSNSEYARTKKRPRGAYFAAGSMLFDADLTAVDVKPRRPVSDRVRAHSCAWALPASACSARERPLRDLGAEPSWPVVG